jgi:histidinol-phosphate/aromatic aminotransferase/cobyric acid decarboxylase-like protein
MRRDHATPRLIFIANPNNPTGTGCVVPRLKFLTRCQTVIVSWMRRI